MAEGDTLINSVIGAVATTVLSGFVPFAPLFGGGIAGYLEGGERNDGLRVGAIAGVMALLPALVIGGLVFAFFLSVIVGGAVAGESAGFGVFGALSLFGFAAFGAFFLVYSVGLSAVGGWLGNYVKYDTDFEV